MIEPTLAEGSTCFAPEDEIRAVVVKKAPVERPGCTGTAREVVWLSRFFTPFQVQEQELPCRLIIVANEIYPVAVTEH